MIDQFKTFFDKYLGDATAGDDTSEQHRLQLATAALLIEMTRADNVVKPAEQAAVARALQKAFQIDEAETREIIRLAEQEAHDATCYHEFTRLINENFSKAQKIQIVELLWEVAFADEEMEPYEEHLVRKLADLLYVPHSEFIRTKLKVQQQLGN